MVFSIIDALSVNNAKESFQIVSQLTEQGIDVKNFLQQFLEVLHEILLSKMGIQNSTYEIPTTQLTLVQIKKLSELISKAYSETKFAVLPQLPLELAIIEWCENKLEVQSEKVKVSENVSKNVLVEDSEVSVSSLRKQVGTIKKIKALYGDKAVATEPVTEAEDLVVTSTVELLHTNGDGTVTDEWIALFWKNLISEMKKYNHTVAGVLRGCKIKNYNNQHLIIQTAYAFHKERLDDMKNRDALLKISKLLTGKDVEITVELKK